MSGRLDGVFDWKSLTKPFFVRISICAACIIHQHRANRRFEGIADGKFLESVVADQFVTGLFGQRCFRARIDRAGRQQRFLHVMPAARFRVRMSAFLGNGRRAHQGRVQPRIDLGGRIDEFLLLILINDGSRDCLAVAVFKDELRFEIEVIRLRR